MPLPTINNVRTPRSFGYGAQLDDLYLRLAIGPGRSMDVGAAQPEATRIDTAQTPEEMTPEFGDIYARSDFSGGEGLDRAHQRTPPANHASRFFDSRGIKVHHSEGGRSHEIGLLRDTAESDFLIADEIRFATDGTDLYATAGTVLRRTSNPLAAVVTWTDENPHDSETATTVHDIAAGGTTLYAALGVNGIHRKEVGGSWAHWNDLEATRVWFLASRLIAAKDNAVYEVPTSGTAPDPIVSFPAGTSIIDAAELGQAILVATSNSRVYALMLADDALTVAAQTHFEHETPTALGASQGWVFLATRQGDGLNGPKRLWRARLRADGVLDDREVLREWAMAGRIAKITATRESVFCALREFPDTVCAWEFNIPHGGLYRSFEFHGVDDDARVTGLTLVEDRLFAGISGEGIHHTIAEYVATGYLITPLGDFFTAEPKAWVTATLGSRVELGQKVRLLYATTAESITDPASPAWREVITVTVEHERVEAAIVATEARFIAGKVVLHASPDRASDPRVRSLAFRGLPITRERVVRLPVNVSDQIVAPGRHALRSPKIGEQLWAELQRRQGRATRLRVFRPGLVIRGVVRSVETPILARTKRGSLTWVSMITVQGRVVPLTAAQHVEGAVGTVGVGLPPMVGMTSEV